MLDKVQQIKLTSLTQQSIGKFTRLIPKVFLVNWIYVFIDHVPDALFVSPKTKLTAYEEKPLTAVVVVVVQNTGILDLELSRFNTKRSIYFATCFYINIESVLRRPATL